MPQLVQSNFSFQLNYIRFLSNIHINTLTISNKI